MIVLQLKKRQQHVVMSCHCHRWLTSPILSWCRRFSAATQIKLLIFLKTFSLFGPTRLWYFSRWVSEAASSSFCWVTVTVRWMRVLSEFLQMQQRNFRLQRFENLKRPAQVSNTNFKVSLSLSLSLLGHIIWSFFGSYIDSSRAVSV